MRAIDRATNAHPAHDADPTPAVYTWIVGAAPVTKFVFCGQVVTQSIIVNNDLADCLWDGIVVGAPGITIDLNGHLIDGKGVGAGIRNDGFDSVTIRNGIVEDFDYGVMLNQGTTRNIVEDITVQKNQESGIVLGRPYPVDPALPQPPEPPSSYDSNVDSNTVRHNRILVNDQGVWLTNKAQSNLIKDNDIAVNGNDGIWVDRANENRIESNEIMMTSGEGVLLEGASGNTIIGNAIEENGGGGVKVGLTTSGTTVGLPSNDNVVEGNSFFENGGNAIELEGKSDSYVYRQRRARQLRARLQRRRHQPRLRARLDHPRQRRAPEQGRHLAQGGRPGTSSRCNDASESEGDGIALESQSHSNVILKNISNMNDGDGIYVGDETSGGSGILIESNHTHDNKGYGIFVPKVSHVIKNNHANDNDSWGIWVSEGSNGRVNIDGGGNRAQGNVGATDPFTLKPLQCYAIQCVGGVPFNSDQIPPITLLVDTPPLQTPDTLATFRFSGSDNASTITFECRLNDGEPEALETVERVRSLHEPADLRRDDAADARHAHVRGARDGRRRERRRVARRVHVVRRAAGRRPGADHEDRLRPHLDDGRPVRDLRVLGRHARRDLRVLARPRGVDRLRVAARVRRPRAPGTTRSTSGRPRTATATRRRPAGRGRSARRRSRTRSPAARSSRAASSRRTT